MDYSPHMDRSFGKSISNRLLFFLSVNIFLLLSLSLSTDLHKVARYSLEAYRYISRQGCMPIRIKLNITDSYPSPSLFLSFVSE